MAPQYNVVFTGELKPGFDRETVISAFSQRFQCNEARAIEVVDAGKPLTMKSAVAMEVAEKFRNVLETLGMTIRLEALSVEPVSTQITTEHSTSSPLPTDVQTADVSQGANPYKAPQANLQDSYQENEMTGPVSVPAGNGVTWIGTAFSNHFRLNPWAWIAATLILGLLSISMQFFPFIGSLGYSLLSPVFAAGLMIGARAQDEGKDFTVEHLFSGFQSSTGQLILFAVIYIVATIIIIAVGLGIMGGSFALFTVPEPDTTDAMIKNTSAILLPLLIMMLLFIPLMMAYWFSPALIALDGLSAIDAMKMSFKGCLKNFVPFLLYGIVMTVLMFIAAIPLLLGFLVVLPVMTASIYTAYRDIYYPEV